MQALEFRDKKTGVRALGVVVAPGSLDAFVEELRTVKLAVVEWKAKRGAGCKRVMFTVVADATLQPDIEGVLRRIYDEEDELSPLLQALDVVDVNLLLPGGVPARQYALGPVRAR